MKKIISVFLGALICAQGVMCFGQSRITEASAVLQSDLSAEDENEYNDDSIKSKMANVLGEIKTRIGDTAEFNEFKSEYEFDEETNMIEYSFTWSKGKDNASLIVECYENGIITYLRSSKEGEETSISEQIENADEYLKNAQSFTDELNPMLKGKLKIKENNSRSIYNLNRFNIARTENGIEVNSSGGYIELSDDGKNIKSFQLFYDNNAEFEDSSNIISKEQAAEAFKTSVPVEMEYFRNYSSNGEEIYKAYVFDLSNGEYINAADNSLIASNELYNIGLTSTAKNMAEDTAETAGGSFSQQELDELENVDGILSYDEAKNIILKNSVLNVKDYNITSMRVSEDSGERFINCDLIKKSDNEDNNLYAYVTIDGKTGDILSFYKEITYSSNAEAINYDTLCERAESAAKSLAGDKFSEYEKNKVSDEAIELYKSKMTADNIYSYSDLCSFTYTRLVNGIKYSYDSINIRINPFTADIESFYIGYTADKSKFPSTAAKLTAEDVYDCVFESCEFSLKYVNTEGNKYVPVYGFFDDSNIKIDVNEGYKLNSDGTKAEEEITGNYKDIDNSPYKSEIKALAVFGKGFRGNKFEPDKSITYKELSQLIDLNDKTLSQSEEEVTKIELAKIMVGKVTNMDKIAKADIYIDKYSDVQRDKGYAILAEALGFLESEGDMFEPDKIITREEAAHAVYVYRFNM